MFFHADVILEFNKTSPRYENLSTISISSLSNVILSFLFFVYKTLTPFAFKICCICYVTLNSRASFVHPVLTVFPYPSIPSSIVNRKDFIFFQSSPCKTKSSAYRISFTIPSPMFFVTSSITTAISRGLNTEPR